MGGLFCSVFLRWQKHRLGGNGCELCAISKANLGAQSWGATVTICVRL
jgi:hypothetical protein